MVTETLTRESPWDEVIDPQAQWAKLADDAEISNAFFEMVDPTVEAEEHRSRSKHWCYWRIFTKAKATDPRKDWIVTGTALGGAWAKEQVDLFEKQYDGEMLDQYGIWSTYRLDPNYRDPIHSDKEHAGAKHPYGKYEGIVRAGGLKEFTVTQIRAHRWHHDPLVQRLRPDACAPDSICDYCPGMNRNFPNESEYMKHIQAMHSVQYAQVQTAQQQRLFLEQFAERLQATNDSNSFNAFLKVFAQMQAGDPSPVPPAGDSPATTVAPVETTILRKSKGDN